MTTTPSEAFVLWQREHAAALEELQEAQRAYHRTVAATAFQGPAEEPSAEEMRRSSLEALDAARSSAVGLDGFVDRWVGRVVRRRHPRPVAPPALLDAAGHGGTQV